MPNQLSHFAIHVDDLDRARKFYGAVFDWRFQGFGGGPITDFCQIKDAAGNLLAPLGAMQSRKFNPAPNPVFGFECSIVMPKATIPGVGWVAKFLDSEGNLACPSVMIPPRSSRGS